MLITSETFAFCKGNATKPSVKELNHDRSWVKSEKPIFLATNGKIYKTWFNSNKYTLLADHNFAYINDFSLSPDTNFIYYEGLNKKHGFTSYIYNTISGEDYKLPNLGPISRLEFSPDSKKVLWINENHKEKQQNLAVVNLENLSLESIPYPVDPFSLGDFRFAEAKWSLDSQDIYLGMIAYSDAAYFKYDVKSKQMYKIDGRHHYFHDYKGTPEQEIQFIENQNKMVYYKPPCLQWQCTNQGKAMVGANAVIDEDYNLKVTTPDGKEFVLDKGEYSQCAGVTIRIISWLENGKYLIYQDPNYITYIYGIKDNKKAVLFDPANMFYGWKDSENRKTLNY